MTDSATVRDIKKKIQMCRDKKFTGLLKVSVQENYWIVYFVLGRLVWLKSRTHALRRWERQLLIHSPTSYKHIIKNARLSSKSWSYAALADLVKVGRFPHEQLSSMVDGAIAEDFFDMLQVGEQRRRENRQMLHYQSVPRRIAHFPDDWVDRDEAWQKAQQLWHEWEQAGLAQVSPDWGAVVPQPKALKLRTSLQTYETLTTFMDVGNTLKDLALKLNSPLVDLTKAVLPYVSRQLLTFTELPDLVENFHHNFYPNLFAEDIDSLDLASKSSVGDIQIAERFIKLAPEEMTTNWPPQSDRTQSPHKVRTATKTTAYHRSYASRSSVLKIVYIDDSPTDARKMAAVVEGLGCWYTNISDPIHALPMLLEIEPDFIFLDLVMPVANGYEVCSQIRRISAFKTTPVVIVTSNDGIGDRVRARFVGASGFLGKPIKQRKIKKVLEKFLRNIDADTLKPPAQQNSHGSNSVFSSS